MAQVDRYILHRLYEWQVDITQSYESLEYSKVVKAVGQLVNQDLSAFYFEIAKDRLYADEKTSHSRRSCQTVLATALSVISCGVSPILCHFAQVG